MRKLAIVGSTGSIGTQTLEICRQFNIPVKALACAYQIDLLCMQACEFHPAVLSVAGEKEARELRAKLEAAEEDIEQPYRPQIYWGEEGLLEVARQPEADMLVAAMVGMAGIVPVLAAIRAGKAIALANKEVLVAAGELIMQEIKAQGVELYPVDSEHSAIWQCLWGNRRDSLRKVFLTASGGPFRNYETARLAAVTVEETLRHPTWKMGGKISVDSATLMNKGLELIEAMHLFNLTAEEIEVVIHPQSIIHSMVEFQDGAVLAQLGDPDMKLPIQLALGFPKRLPAAERSFVPWSASSAELSFSAPDLDKFPCLALAMQAARDKKSMAICMNAANEVAVAAFLAGKITYLDIAAVVEDVMAEHGKEGTASADTLSAIMAFDEWGRRLAAEKVLSRHVHN